MVAAIVAVIGFVGFTFVKGGDDGGNEASVAEGAQPSSGQSASSGAKPDKPADPKPEPSDSAIAAAPADKVTVKVSATEGRSWISAQDHSGRLLFDGLLKQGDSKTFQDDEKVKLRPRRRRSHPALRQRQEDRGRLPARRRRAPHVHEGRPAGRIGDAGDE
ncbi:hypothetical protein STENM327S_04161 [Streptomyces tendae]